MNDPVIALVDRLESQGFNPRPTGQDSWESRCPAHQGSRPNLSVARGDDGRVLVHCQHAPGCSHKDIVAALGMTEGDLFPDDPNRPTRPASNGNGKPKPKGRTFPTVQVAVWSLAFKLGTPRAWLYRNANGAESMAVARFDGPDGSKTYRPLRRTADGWEWGDPPGLLPLYHLPELAAANRVYICEGEKAGDLTRNLGVAATTSAHGAKSPHKSDWSPLAEKEVIILPDHDEPGEVYAKTLVGLLAGLHPQPTVKILRLAEHMLTGKPMPDGGDVEEWLSVGVPDSWSVEQRRAELERVADLTTAEVLPDPIPAEPKGDDEPDDEPIVIPAWPDPPSPAAYHGPLGDIALAIAPHSEADPVAILTQLAVGFGNMIGRTVHVELDGARHHANEFIGLVGGTATGRKGTSWSHARHRLAEIDPTWASDHIKGGLSTGEGLIYHVRDRVMGEDPKSHEQVITDPGVEDKRMLIIETELGSVLKRAGQNGSTLTAVIRQAFDGDSLATLTRNSPMKATGAHVSIVGHITSEELASLLSKVDAVNGFGNRFLWLAVRRSKSLPFGGGLEQVDFRPMDRRIQEATAFARGLNRINRDSEANRLWADHYERLTAGRPGAMGSIIARATAHVMRLALISAMSDQSRVIRSDHLQAALALWDYAERSAAYIFGDSLADPVADKLLAALRAAPEGLTRTEISVGVFKRHKSKGEIRQALATLAKSGLAHSRTVATGGRSEERWFSGPAPCEKSERSEVSRPARPLTSLSSHISQPPDDRTAANDREVFEL